MRLLLTRFFSHPLATLGTLALEKTEKSAKLISFTLELPWKDNQQQVSCIPEGEYELRKVRSQRFGDVFLVQNVPGREDILIHSGNSASDTKGCILPGLRCSYEPAVYNSRDALKRLMAALPAISSLQVRSCR